VPTFVFMLVMDVSLSREPLTALPVLDSLREVLVQSSRFPRGVGRSKCAIAIDSPSIAQVVPVSARARVAVSLEAARPARLRWAMLLAVLAVLRAECCMAFRYSAPVRVAQHILFGRCSPKQAPSARA